MCTPVQYNWSTLLSIMVYWIRIIMVWSRIRNKYFRIHSTAVSFAKTNDADYVFSSLFLVNSPIPFSRFLHFVFCHALLSTFQLPVFLISSQSWPIGIHISEDFHVVYSMLQLLYPVIWVTRLCFGKFATLFSRRWTAGKRKAESDTLVGVTLLTTIQAPGWLFITS
jgi:hypothetical protein